MAEAGQYAATRNYDYGPQKRTNVSQLSFEIRHRALPEWKVIELILQHYSLDAVEKFVDEVLWRTYWKGWLEQHPSVFDNWLSALNLSDEFLEQTIGPGRNFPHACMNLWFDELVETGYLHNHARMWFASIWVHTYHYSWESGALLFHRYLSDADCGSNILSWRWVTGLQTKGKAYLAKAWNIEKFTDGRHRPLRPLATQAIEVLDETVAREAIDFGVRMSDAIKVDHHKWFLHEDDLNLPIDEDDLNHMSIRVLVPRKHYLGTRIVCDAQHRIKRRAIELLFKTKYNLEVQWITEHELKDGDCTWRAPCGLTRTTLDGHEKEVTLYDHRYDQVLWPHASKGFFNFKKHAYRELQELGLV